MKAVVTGATGLLGANLCVELLAGGHDVRATRRAGSRTAVLAGHDVDWVAGDVTERASLTGAFRGADVVFNCAALIRVEQRITRDVMATNVEGPANVMAAAREAGVGRLVHCSSVATVGIAGPGAVASEDTAWNLPEHGLDDAYSTTKRLGERIVLDAADRLDVVVVNPSLMIGPLDAKPSSGRVILPVARGVMPFWPPGVCNVVDVRDVARGMVLAAAGGRRGRRYILAGENVTFRDLFTRIARLAGARPPRVPLVAPLDRVLGLAGDLSVRLTGGEPALTSSSVAWSRCRDYRFSSARAEEELGYAPGPIVPAIADSLAWFAERGWLPGRAGAAPS